MTQREELLSVPKRKWDDVIHGVDIVYIIPSRRKHDSGYACMDFVASFHRNKKRPMVRFGGGCDDVRLHGSHFRMDCEYPSRIIRIWNDSTSFFISIDLSSIDFVEESK